MSNSKLKVLFLCTWNSCRSQMAHGFTNTLKKDVVDAYSAGIESNVVNPNAIKVMKEIGIYLSGHKSTSLDEYVHMKFDYVVTVCDNANEQCPIFPGKTKHIHRGFDDPPKLAENAKTEEEKLNHYRRVRDEIEKFVMQIPEILKKE